MTYNLTFSAGFAGTKQIYMQAADNTGVIEAWHQIGDVESVSGIEARNAVGLVDSVTLGAESRTALGSVTGDAANSILGDHLDLRIPRSNQVPDLDNAGVIGSLHVDLFRAGKPGRESQVVCHRKVRSARRAAGTRAVQGALAV